MKVSDIICPTLSSVSGHCTVIPTCIYRPANAEAIANTMPVTLSMYVLSLFQTSHQRSLIFFPDNDNRTIMTL
jgi:hypothetical protein